MRNIEKFDEVAGLIFARLYEKFPVSVNITAGEIVESMKPFEDSEDEFTDAFIDMVEIIPSTITWLHDEGFIRLEGSNSSTLFESSWRGVTLTGKALSALKATPHSLETTTSIGEKIASAAREGGKEVLLASVNQLLATGTRILLGD